MDPFVDRAYHLQEKNTEPSGSPTDRVHRKTPSDFAIVDDLSRKITTLSVKSKTGALVVTGNLASLLKKFPDRLAFEPEDEKAAAPLKTLPEELLILILCNVDPTTVERFAAVSRKARVLSLDPTIWR